MSQILLGYEKELDQQKMPAGKKKVLLAALKLFANNGFHDTKTAEIAELAGVSEGTIYKYFRSKDDLLTKLLNPMFVEVKSNFLKQLDQYNKLDELVSFVVEDRINFFIVNLDLSKLVLQELLIGKDPSLYYKDVITGENGLINEIAKIKLRFKEIDQTLTQIQIFRIFIGPISAYVVQKQLFDHDNISQEVDFQLIKKQIMAGLIKTSA